MLCGTSVRPSVTPATTSATHASREYCGAHDAMGSRRRTSRIQRFSPFPPLRVDKLSFDIFEFKIQQFPSIIRGPDPQLWRIRIARTQHRGLLAGGCRPRERRPWTDEQTGSAGYNSSIITASFISSTSKYADQTITLSSSSLITPLSFKWADYTQCARFVSNTFSV